MIATKETANTTVVVGRLERERVFSWLGLGLPLVISAILNFWNLTQNGYSNLYYSVAVQSMMQSWHNFFFASYDPGGFITVDKPPVSLWIQTVSAKIFGFNSWSLLMPEALAGVASVALVYFLVRRLFGSLAAFVAALALALTPIAVAVERTNNTDTWLMFFLLLAAFAITKATEKGQFKFLALGLALVGVGFNTKMLAAFVVLPTFFLLYFIAAPVSWPRRLVHLTLGGLVLLTVALSWPLAVDLTPADQRPWVGGSQQNSVLDLALNYNGLGRVTGDEGNGFGGPAGGGRNFGGGNLPGGGFQNGRPGNFPPGGFGGRAPGAPFGGGGGGGGGGMFGAGYAGPLRLFFGGELAEQWSWLFPIAAFGLLAAVLAVRRKWPLEPKGQTLLLWAGWLATYGGVFSMAEGIFHPYYLIMLAPAMAALVGIGVAALWSAYRGGGWQAWLLPLSLFITSIWQIAVLSQYPQWSVWLVPLTLAGSLLAAIPLAGVRFMEYGVWRRTSPGLVAVGLVGLLISPLVWSITPVFAAPNNASLPVAGPSAISDNSSTWTRLNDSANSGLLSYLEANRNGAYYLLAVTNSQQASSIALETGEPVLAMGGFMGSDPAMTVETLQQMVADNQINFIMAGNMGRGFGGGGGGTSSVNGWIRANCTAVDTSQYGSLSGLGLGGGPGGFMGGGGQLYSCAAK